MEENMRPVTFNQFPEQEQQEVACAYARYRYWRPDFLIKGAGDDVLVWSFGSGKRRRYKAVDDPTWITQFEGDLREQYFSILEG
jgi:hypothetical protein